MANLYHELLDKIEIRDEVDYLAAILTIGRILDMKTKDDTFMADIEKFIVTFREAITDKLTAPIIGNEDKLGAEQLIDVYKVTNNDFASALLTTSYVFLTHEIETVIKSVELWDVIRDENIVQHKLDYIAAILATGRIRDLKSKVNVPIEIKQIAQNLKNVMTDKYQLKLETLEQRDIACAFITATYVSRTPPIETNSQIIDLWNDARLKLNLSNDEIDTIIAILICGIIRGIKLETDWDILNAKLDNIRENL